MATLNITNIPAPRVPFIDERTGLMAREWYRFFLNLFVLTGSGNNPITLEELQLEPPNQPNLAELLIQVNQNIAPQYQDQSGDFLATLDTAQLMSMMARFENLEAAIQGAYLNPPQTPATGGEVFGPSSSTDNAIARFDGTTGKVIQNSVTTIDDTGNASGILSQQFSNGTAVTLAAGKMWYDGTTGAWNAGMGNGNITQQIGEEIFVYGKASAAITDSPLQIIYHTGVVGASGVITFAPTIVGITDANAIIGVATENLALNGFGRVTVFGVVRGITTNGTAFGEVWADDDVIWYNPVTGNPTKVEPVAPYIKVQVGLVIKAGAGGSGSFQVGIARGSKLGGTDSNVQFSALANNNLITYDTGVGYWKNTATGTGVVTALGVNTGTAGAFVVNGGALGTPSSGTVTNLTGTASININGTVGATTANTGAFTTLSATGITTVAAGSAALPAIVSTTGTADTGLWFPAADTIAFSTAASERMRINSSGNLGLGVTPSAWVTFKAIEVTGGAIAGITTNQLDVVQNAYYDGAFKYKTTYGATFYQQTNSTHYWYTAPSGTIDTAITFTERMNLSTTGVAVTGTAIASTSVGVGNTTPSGGGAGIAFPATQSASTDANTLDDYEEGSWTISFDGGTGAFTSNTGKYTKIGNQVTCFFDITVNTIGTSPTSRLSGLPFTAASGGANSCGVFGFWSNAANSMTGAPSIYVGGGSTIWYFTGSILAVTTASSWSALGNGARIAGTFIYYV